MSFWSQYILQQLKKACKDDVQSYYADVTFVRLETKNITVWLLNVYIFMYICFFICKCHKILQSINSTARHLKCSSISILTNLLRTENKTKIVKTLYN